MASDETSAPPPGWIPVDGVVVRGFRVASGVGRYSPYPDGTITLQLPYFLRLGLDLSSYYPGTLNISIGPKRFALKKPRHTFHAVRWSKQHPPEDFSFSPCRVNVGTRRYRGHVYYPHPETKQQHFHDDSTLEILTHFIPDIRYGTRVQVRVRSEEIAIVLGVGSPDRPPSPPKPPA